MGVSPVLDFVRSHKLLLGSAVLAGAGAVAMGGYRAYAGPREQDPDADFLERTGNRVGSAARAGVTGAAVGAGLLPFGKAYAQDTWGLGKDLQGVMAEKQAARAATKAARAIDPAAARVLPRGPGVMTTAFSHGVTGAAIGGALGAALSYHRNDGDPVSTATGAVVGAAVGTLAVPTLSRMASGWSNLGKWGKRGIGVAAVASAAAWAHNLVPPEYEDEAAALPETPFNYDYGPTLSQRLAAMNGTGDVVLGLHNRR